MYFTENEYALVRKISSKVSRKWSAITYEDIVGDLYLWLCVNYKWVSRYRDDQYGEAKLFVALWREATKKATREQSISNGAPLDHEDTYDTDTIERLLPLIFDTPPSHSVPENPRNGQPIGEVDSTDYDTALAALLDVRQAYSALPDEFKLILALRYRDDLTFSRIGKELGISDRGASKKAERAVVMIRQFLS